MSPQPKHTHQFIVPVLWKYLTETGTGRMIYTGIEVTRLRCNGCDAEVDR